MAAFVASNDFTEEQVMLREMARDFARREIAPVAEHFDRANEFPWDVVRKAQQIGLTALNVPETYGGGGANVLEECIVGEELAWACSGISTAVTVNNLAALPIILAASDEQKKYWLGERLVDAQGLASYCVTEPGAGSNVVGISTRAVKRGDSYVLNGTKTFISNASHANFFVVFAVTDPDAGHRGLSIFAVDRNSPGVSVSGHFDKMGQRASDTAEVTFEDVEVPAAHRLGEEGQGFYTAMQVFDKSRPTVSAGAVGVHQRALDESTKYAAERQTFGVPIWQHQAVGHMIADMAINLEASRSLLYRAARAVDAGDKDKTRLAAMTKALCADNAMKACVDAVQVFGGYGYMREYPVEKLMRDVKVFQIYEGTSQIQRNIITRELFRNG